MNRLLTITMIVSIVLLGGCAPFPTSYDRVDPDMVRTLDFSYEPADAAPGDSVTVTAVFAGKSIDPVRDIAWSASWSVLTNAYGTDTALDIRPLDIVAEPHRFSAATNSVRFRFKIPENAVRESKQIPEDWLGTLPLSLRQNLPPILGTATKGQVLDIIGIMSAQVPGWSALLTNDVNGRIHDSLMQADSLYAFYTMGVEPFLPLLLQMMTSKVQIFADLKIPDGHRIRSTFAVRYHNRFAAMPRSRVFVNTNPGVDSVMVYVIDKPRLQYFDPRSSEHPFTAMRLDNLPENSLPLIVIDTGKSYFMGGITSRIDPVLTIDSALTGGGPLTEQQTGLWYFQLHGGELTKASAFNYMNIVNMGSLFPVIYPATDQRVEQATVWLEVSDFLFNELHRPRGSTLVEVRMRFEYTKAWLDAKVGKKIE